MGIFNFVKDFVVYDENGYDLDGYDKNGIGVEKNLKKCSHWE
jgi:hypothetical protein